MKNFLIFLILLSILLIAFVYIGQLTNTTDETIFGSILTTLTGVIEKVKQIRLLPGSTLQPGTEDIILQ